MIFVPEIPLADWIRETLELYFAAMLESDSPGWIWWFTSCSPSRRENGAGAEGEAPELVAATAAFEAEGTLGTGPAVPPRFAEVSG